jgi:hypothetical protein
VQPAVITFRPDNLLTVGLLGAIAYVAALLLVQLAMRAGLIAPAPPPPVTVVPAAGTVAAA